MTSARSIRPRGHLVLSCLAGLSLLLAASQALALCPDSHLLFPGSGPFDTSAPAFDMTSPDGSWIRGDHAIGEYSLHHGGYLSPTDVIARDRFDVTGVPPGTPVSVTIGFPIAGWVFSGGCGGTGCCGYLVATIRAGEDTATVTLVGQTFGGTAYFNGAVVLPITLIAGTPRDIEVEMLARRCAGGAGHTVDATGHILFVGDDAAAAIVSCKGFGPASVPVRTRSWGELKTIYR